MKIAIYCRVSTTEQNPENQRIRLSEYARDKGWIFEVYTEAPQFGGSIKYSSMVVLFIAITSRISSLYMNFCSSH